MKKKVRFQKLLGFLLLSVIIVGHSFPYQRLISTYENDIQVRSKTSSNGLDVGKAD